MSTHGHDPGNQATSTRHRRWRAFEPDGPRPHGYAPSGASSGWMDTLRPVLLVVQRAGRAGGLREVHGRAGLEGNDHYPRWAGQLPGGEVAGEIGLGIGPAAVARPPGLAEDRQAAAGREARQDVARDEFGKQADLEMEV
jgi:hypothetical protein